MVITFNYPSLLLAQYSVAVELNFYRHNHTRFEDLTESFASKFIEKMFRGSG